MAKPPARPNVTPGICSACKKRRCAGKCLLPICQACGRRHYGDCQSPMSVAIRAEKARRRPGYSSEPAPLMSPIQDAILRRCHEFIMTHGYSPSTRELAELAGASSTSVVNYNLNWLQGRGYITRADDLRIARSIRLTEKGVAYYDKK